MSIYDEHLERQKKLTEAKEAAAAKIVRESEEKEKEVLPYVQRALAVLIDDERGLKGVLRDTNVEKLLADIQRLVKGIDVLAAYEQRIASVSAQAVSADVRAALTILQKISRIKALLRPLYSALQVAPDHQHAALALEHSHLIENAVALVQEIEDQLR